MLRPLLRWRYLILVVVSYASAFQHLRGTGYDWRYFVTGSELLLGQHHPATPFPGGIHFYANYPDFQIGPLSFVIATPFRIFGNSSRVLGAMAMTALAPAVVYLLERTALRVQPSDDKTDILFRQLTVLLGGLTVAVAWAPLAAIYAHLDDGIAIAACVVALFCVAAVRPFWAGVAIGAAVAAKPWGVAALPLALAFSGRARRTAVATALCASTLAWAPFVLGDPATLRAAQPQVVVSQASVPHLFGLAIDLAPTWIRVVELVGTILMGTLAVLRGRWTGALLVAIATRLLLDPQTILYYDTGLVVAALSWDLLRTRRPLPVATVLAFVFVNDGYTLFRNYLLAAGMRLVVTLGLIAAVVYVGRSRQSLRGWTDSPQLEH